MRICLDARQLEEPTTGVGRYAFGLVRELAHLDPDNEYVVLKRKSLPSPIVRAENFRELTVPYHISTLSNFFRGSRVINPLEADIYHSLHHFFPFGVRAKRLVVTLHDLIWVNHIRHAYEAFRLRASRRWLHGPWIGWTVRRADKVIAVSDFTRREAIDTYRMPPEKVVRVYHGVDPPDGGSHPDGGPRAGGAGSNPPPGRRPPSGRFIFSLGHTKPYKNIPRLVEAFARLAAGFPDLCLIVAGRGEGYPSLKALVRRLGIVEKVVFSGLLTNDEVTDCLRRAQFLAFPSLVEGFGFPVLEAMAAGCPVLASRGTSLEEIAGDAAVLVDPADVESIAAGMRRLLEEERLRDDLRLKGIRTAAAFTWHMTAEKTLEVYRSLFI